MARLSEWIFEAWCRRANGLDPSRLRRMEAGEEAIPEAWARAIEESTGGGVKRSEWPLIEPTPKFEGLDPGKDSARGMPRKGTMLGADSEDLLTRQRRGGRKQRQNPAHAVYQWLDAIEKNASWLVRELLSQYQIKYSRASLQFCIAGVRPEKGERYSNAYTPHEIVWAVKKLSKGRVKESDWNHVKLPYSDAEVERKRRGRV